MDNDVEPHHLSACSDCLRQHTKMDTLPNVNTPRGGNKPSHAGFASNVSPEVQCPQAENSHTGVTSPFVPKPNHHWFVFRVLYGHTAEALKALNDAGVTVYIPMRNQTKLVSGKRIFVRQPLLPGLVFAYMTREKTHEFVRHPAKTASFLKYYTDKTKPVEAGTMHNPPVIIADNVMLRFIEASRVESEHSMILPHERCRFKKNELVRVTAGAFKGIVGRVIRAAGQQRVGISINGVGIFVTAYIPSDFMEICDNRTTEST